MANAPLLVRLPEPLLRRLRARVAPRQRSAFVEALIAQALPPDDDADLLYQAALAVEQDEALTAEMAEWEATSGDGLGEAAPPRRRR